MCSTFIAGSTPTTVFYQADVVSIVPTQVVDKIPTTEQVRAAIVAEFGADSVMVRIAQCEGHFRQIDPDTGEAIRGEINPLDRGVFQINEKYHLTASQKMGIDIMTLSGNIKYARYLYDKQGTVPWNWSKSCWGESKTNPGSSG